MKVLAHWRLAAGMLLTLLWAGCATERVDWSARIGHYTYDQAVIDLGPPDKQAKLSDGSIVAEWLTYRGHSYYSYPPIGYGYSPWYYGPYYGPYYYGGAYVDSSPNYFIRLTFGPEGLLKAWKRFYK
jgi:hypothetical protein